MLYVDIMYSLCIFPKTGMGRRVTQSAARVLGRGSQAEDPGLNPTWDHLLHAIAFVSPLQKSLSTIKPVVAIKARVAKRQGLPPSNLYLQKSLQNSFKTQR